MTLSQRSLSYSVVCTVVFSTVFLHCCEMSGWKEHFSRWVFCVRRVEDRESRADLGEIADCGPAISEIGVLESKNLVRPPSQFSPPVPGSFPSGEGIESLSVN